MNPFPTLLRTIVCGFLLGNVASVSMLAQEQEFPEHNCAITPPAGWEKLSGVNQPGLVAAFGNADRTRLLVVIADTTSPATQIDDNFVPEFERGVERGGGGKRISGRFVDFNGIKSYERLGSATINGHATSILTRTLPGEGAMYSIQAMRIDGDVGEARELREAVETFRFLTPPSLPTLRAPSAAYRTGYFMGKLMCSSVFLLAIVAVVVVIVRASRQKPPSVPAVTMSTQPQQPPPLPPESK